MTDFDILIFDSTFYLSVGPNADLRETFFVNAEPGTTVEEVRIDAFDHFIAFGNDEGRPFSPFLEPANDDLFDDASYLANNPAAQDAIDAGQVGSAFEHYVRFGNDLDSLDDQQALDGSDPQADPNQFFDTAAYLAANPDVAAAGVNAYLHYFEFGESEIRQGLRPAFLDNNGDNVFTPGVDARFTPGFDPVFYLNNNPDVAAFVDAAPEFGTLGLQTGLQHFIQIGFSEGRPGIPSGGEVSQGFTDLSGEIVTFTVNTNGGQNPLRPEQGDLDGNGEIDLTGEGDLALLRVTGDANLSVDITDTGEQIEQIDLDGDGVFDTQAEFNAREILNVTNFKLFDAAPRNVNGGAFDATNNFIGSLNFRGEGFGGDGTATDGNVVLGGLGGDNILTGIGNDFIAPGGFVNGAQGNSVNGGGDRVQTGRNTDFIFIEGSIPDQNVIGNQGFTVIDGGSTVDDERIIGDDEVTLLQDNDFLLFEGTDDEEPFTVRLDEGGAGSQFTGAGTADVTDSSGVTVADLIDVESFDASGNLYGVFDAEVGAQFFEAGLKLGGLRDTDETYIALAATDPNKDGDLSDAFLPFGRGSTAQLVVEGTPVGNVIIGGYDNDRIRSGDGDDVILGGDLEFLIRNGNNSNLLDQGDLETAATLGAVRVTANDTDGKILDDGLDSIDAGADDDFVMFDLSDRLADGNVDDTTNLGSIQIRDDADPVDDGDTLFLTEFSLGAAVGTTVGTTGVSGGALGAGLSDNTIRFDLGNQNGSGGDANLDGIGDGNVGSGLAAFRNYGNSEVGGTAFQSTVAPELAVGGVVEIDNFENVITTGLGGFDYNIIGDGNAEVLPERANLGGINQPFDLRGDTNENALYANGRDDVLEGREGDDLLSGNDGKDDFLFSVSDDADLIWRQADLNGDGFQDVDPTTGELLFTKDYRIGAQLDAESQIIYQFLNFDAVDGGEDDIPDITFFSYQIGSDEDGFELVNVGINDLEGGATTLTELAAEFNEANTDPDITAVAGATTITITDAAGRTFKNASVSGNIDDDPLDVQAVTTLDEVLLGDRLIFVDYSARNTNTRVDETTNDLDIQGADFVIDFGAQRFGGNDAVQSDFDADGVLDTGTTLANDQIVEFVIDLTTIAVGDTLKLTLNGVEFESAAYAGTVFVDNTGAPGGGADGNNDNGVADFELFVNTFINSIADESRDPNSQAANIDVRLGATTLDFDEDKSNDELAFRLETQADAQFGGANRHVAFLDVDSASEQFVKIFDNTGQDDAVGVAVDLFGFDVRNDPDGGFTKEDILFVGAGTNDTFEDEDSVAGILVDRADGSLFKGTITGFDENTNGKNGDDLIVGSDVDDVINAGSGDDLIYGTKSVLLIGADTIDGGGDDDYVVFDEQLFGDFAEFTIVAPGLLAADQTTVVNVNVDADAEIEYRTNLLNVETLRTLSNTKNDTYDLSAVSDDIVADRAGDNVIGPDDNVNAGGDNQPDFEGLNIRLTTETNGAGDAGVTYDKDVNDNDALTNDDIFTDKDEVDLGGLVLVLGAENIITGKANDLVYLDQSQLGVANTLSLGDQTDGDITGRNENDDKVTVDHSNVTSTADNDGDGVAGDAEDDLSVRPTITFTVETATETDVISYAGGSDDTLVDVERFDATLAATGIDFTDLDDDDDADVRFGQDVLDVSNLGGAVVNFGGPVALDDTKGGVDGAVSSLTILEGNTLEAGGVTVNDSTLGNETVEIDGITQFERVTGSSGNDRVILADNQVNQDDDAGLKVGFLEAALGFTTEFGIADDGDGKIDVAGEVAANNVVLLQFSLAGGTDIGDYRNEGSDLNFVITSVDEEADFIADVDWVLVDEGDDNNLNGSAKDRVDLFKDGGAEQYVGGTGVNTIDLSSTDENLTVQFNAGDVADENGEEDSADTSFETVTVKEGTGADDTLFVTFIEDSGNFEFDRVIGSDFANTIRLTNNEADRNQDFFLNGGANVLDYSGNTFSDDGDNTNDGAPITVFLGEFQESDGAGDLTGNSNDDADPLGRFVNDFDTNAEQYAKITTGNLGGVDYVANEGDITFIGTGKSDLIDLRNGGADLSFNIDPFKDSATDDDTFDDDGVEEIFINLVTGVVQDGNLDTTTFVSFEDVNATKYNDVITGSSAVNVINAFEGDDVVLGGDGADTIVAGQGEDEITGQAGGDVIDLANSGAPAGELVDRVIYTSVSDGNTVPTGGGLSVGTGSADSVSNFTTSEDFVVFSGGLTNVLTTNGVINAGSINSFDVDEGGVFFLEDNIGIKIEDFDLGDAAAKFGVISDLDNGDDIFLVVKDSDNDVGIFYYENTNNNGAIDSGDTLVLVSELNDVAGTISARDLVIRIEFTDSVDPLVDLEFNDGRAELVFDDNNPGGALDSTTEGIDTIVGFTAGNDLIDISDFSIENKAGGLENTGGDAIFDVDGDGVKGNESPGDDDAAFDGGKGAENGDGIDDALQVLDVRVSSTTGTTDSKADFFNSTIFGGDVVIVAEQLGGTEIGDINNFRIFVDLDRNGDFDEDTDLAFDLNEADLFTNGLRVDYGGQLGEIQFEPIGDIIFVGTVNGDTEAGTAGENLFLGDGGNDSFTGGGGDDILIGGNRLQIDDAEVALALSAIDLKTGDRVLSTTTIDLDRDGNPDPFDVDLVVDLGLPTTGSNKVQLLTTGTGTDTLDGGAGNDVLIGDDEDDVLFGGEGIDVLVGGKGEDQANGGDGNDIFLVFTDDLGGDDVFNGNAGNFDVLDLRDVVGKALLIDLSVGSSDNFDTDFSGAFTIDDGSILNIEVIVGSDDATQVDTFVGGSAPQIFFGLKGDDVLTGGLQDDELYGGEGGDTLTGLAGDDIIEGGAGDDTIDGGAGEDTIRDGDGADTILGGDGDDLIILSDDGVDETSVDLSADAEGNEVLGDTADLSADNEDLTVDLAAGTVAGATDIEAAGNLAFGANKLENIILGDGDDKVADSTDDNIVVDGGGEDIITLTAGGVDTFRVSPDGEQDKASGTGDEVLDLSLGTTSVTVNLFNDTSGDDTKLVISGGGFGDTDGFVGGADDDGLEGFVDVIGTGFADTISSGAAGTQNVLDGGASADTFFFDDGAGTILSTEANATGGTGDVIINFEDGSDRINLSNLSLTNQTVNGTVASVGVFTAAAGGANFFDDGGTDDGVKVEFNDAVADFVGDATLDDVFRVFVDVNNDGNLDAADLAFDIVVDGDLNSTETSLGFSTADFIF